MRIRLVTLLLSVAAVGCAAVPDPEAPLSQEPARLAVEMFGGFPRDRAGLGQPHTVLVLDATSGMSRADRTGLRHIRAGRVAAARFARQLPAARSLDVFVVGGTSRARCDALPDALEGDRQTIATRLETLRATGRGSTAALLSALVPEEGFPPDRVVLVSNLRDSCGADLCAAAQTLATHGARLDVVRIGDAPTPACLEGVRSYDTHAAPADWTLETPHTFHVEDPGDGSRRVSGDVNGIPVEVEPGRAAVVVDLVPPLRVEREFPPGTRWKLEVVDFPGLKPPERQWRWRQIPPPAIGVEEASATGGSAATP